MGKVQSLKIASNLEPKSLLIGSRFKLWNDLRTAPFCWQTTYLKYKQHSLIGLNFQSVQVQLPVTAGLSYALIDKTGIQSMNW